MYDNVKRSFLTAHASRKISDFSHSSATARAHVRLITRQLTGVTRGLPAHDQPHHPQHILLDLAAFVPLGYQDKGDQIDWGWHGSDENGGGAYADNEARVIDLVQFGLDTPIDLATIQERFGIPSHALLTVVKDPHSRNVTWKLEFIYVDRGMILSDISPTPPVLKTLLIDQVLFTQPDEAHILVNLVGTAGTTPLYPSREGAPLTTYCDENYNYERCRLFQ